MRFFFYQQYRNMHFSPILRALAGKREVIWCVDMDMDPRRARMGFVLPETRHVKVKVGLSREEIEMNIIKGHPEDVHIASLSRTNRAATIIRRLRRKMLFRFGIASEYLKFGREGWLSLPYFLFTMGQVRLYRSRIDFVLAMGEIGRQQFCRLGFAPEKVFPFCYAIEPARGNACESPRNEMDYEILFSGSLYSWKAMDALLRALSRIRNRRWKLRVLGDGPERLKLEALALDLGIERKIVWHGFLSNAEARALIGCADLLVLPSHYEGWGAVVNEALMAGTPVVVSDRCGSCVLLDGKSRGSVFRSGDVNDLCHALETRLQGRPPTACERAAVKAWSRRIEAPAVAQYLEQVMECVYHDGQRPAPPWQ